MLNESQWTFCFHLYEILKKGKTEVTADQWFSVAVIKERSPTRSRRKHFKGKGTALYVGFGRGFTVTKIHQPLLLKWINFIEYK